MLTSRENLLKVFRHEKPEWIPVIAHIDPFNQPSREGMDPVLQEALGTVTFGDGSDLAFTEALGVEVMDNVNPPIECKYHKTTVERIDLADGWVTRYKTPYGELHEKYKYVREDGTTFCMEHMVNGEDDLKIFMHILDDAEYVLRDGALDFIQDLKTKIGDRGLLRAYMPGTPLGMMVRFYTRLDTLSYLWADNRDELHSLLDVMGENHLRQFELAASLGYDILYGTDDTSTTTISPGMFEEFCMGYTDRIADALHKYGVLYCHHSCGHVNKLLDLYRQTRMDVVDAIGPRPNDVPTFAMIREMLGPNIAIISGMAWTRDPHSKDTAEERKKVAEVIEYRFKESAPGHNIVFSIHPFPFHNMDQMNFVAEECKKHQRMFSGVRI